MQLILCAIPGKLIIGKIYIFDDKASTARKGETKALLPTWIVAYRHW
jgi:hypothetical protein